MMKLKRFRVEQVRKFMGPAEIRDLEPGINLFTGPNESGKTTMVRAIRAGFFDPYKSSSAKSLLPWNDSGASPSVEIEFEWQGERWLLRKSFLTKKRCDLIVGNTSYNGEEAEEKLAALLGYEFPSRGPSQQRHQGVPGLLWVEQGAGHEITDPVKHAGQHLKAALGESLGEIASSGGDELIEEVLANRAKLLTPTGKATGVYREAIEQYENLTVEYDEMEARLHQYRQHVDRLGQLQVEGRRDREERIWEQHRENARAAENQLAKVSEWQRDQERDQNTLKEYGAGIEAYMDVLDGIQQKKRNLEQRVRDLESYQQKLEQLVSRQPSVDKKMQVAKDDLERARSVIRKANEQERCRSLNQELQRLNSELEALTPKLECARDLNQSLQENRQLQSELEIDDSAHQRLKRVTQILDQFRIQEESIATRIEYDLELGQFIHLGENLVSGRGEKTLLEPETIQIPGIGSIRVSPGGEDVAAFARERQVLIEEHEQLLEKLNAESLEDAEAKLEQYREISQEIKIDQSKLATIAPEGIDALVNTIRVTENKKNELETDMQALEAPNEDSPSLGSAQTQFDGAENSLRQVEKEASYLKSEMRLAEQSVKTAKQEEQRLLDELEAPGRRDREQNAEQRLLELQAKWNQLSKTVEQREMQIAQSRPDILRQDIERLNRSADAAEKAGEKRKLEMGRLQARLEEAGAEGLGEKEGELDAKLDGAYRRKNELERQAKALDFLYQKLTARRLELTKQLQAPLQRHLNKYLELLFSNASLTVDENLIPDVLVRSGMAREERGQFEELSFGSREQMALISRLAYADLLQEAGKPTLLILDDALVNSDPERLEKMKRVLFDAAQRHQILLFSCHPENWRNVGASQHAILEFS